jgi:hypothetical protein
MTAVNLRCQLTAENQETRVNGHYVGGASLSLTTGHWTVGFPRCVFVDFIKTWRPQLLVADPTHVGAL